MSRIPRVSIIMAALNAGPFVQPALASLREQTFADFELLVVDDGSTDDTAAVVAGAAERDERIRLVRQPHQGIAAARNAALARARGELVAVADADDIQLPGRLRHLVDAFDADPKLGVCGGWVETWGEGHGRRTICSMPEQDAGIRAGMPFESMLFDPTVMYRRRVLADSVRGYDPAFRMAVDYDLWSRLLDRETFHNCPRVLTRYRRHEAQVTSVEGRSGRSLEERRRIWSRVLERHFGLVPTEVQLRANELAANWPQRVTGDERQAVRQWLETLLEVNRVRGGLPIRELERQLAHRWHWVCGRSVHEGLPLWFEYRRSPLGRLSGVSVKSRMGLAWRCLRRRG